MRLSVKDVGLGLTPEAGDKLFEATSLAKVAILKCITKLGGGE